jgi:hypothetical protein
VSDASRSIPPPRARPVAELALDTLLARADELARRWAIALILARPLDGIGGIPLEELARGAPALCAQTIRALYSETELDRLSASDAPSGRERSAAARSLGEMSGADDAPSVVQAVEALRGTLWEGLLEEVRPPAPGATGARQLADLGDRLAYVCSRLLTAALQDGAGLAEEHEPGGQAPPQARAQDSGRQGAERGGAVVVDERNEPPRSGARRRDGATEPTRVPVREARREEIEIHDARAGDGPAAWIGSIGRQLERTREDGLPFAVLLLEPLDVERLRVGEPSTEVLRLAEELEDVLAVTLRETPERAAQPPGRGRAPWSGSLTRERPGRYWLLVAETGRAGAERLAQRLTRAVATVIEYGGAPLEVVIGIAVCPDDGLQAPALAAHADIGLYAARSARVRAPRRAALDETAR